MLTTSKITAVCLTAAVCSMLTIPAASAATISQTVNSGSTTSWNDAMWGVGPVAPTAGNDYVSAASGSATTIYTVNGIVWSQLNWTVQDTDANTTAASTSGSFLGDSLRLSTQAPMNGKATGGSTQTANIIFDGGFYRGNYVYNSTASASSTLAGTISFATGSTSAAIGMLSPNNAQIYTFNVDSTITGGAGNLLQLTMNGGTGRESHFNLNSDLSGFFGTIYVGASTSGLTTGIKAGSFFSITSDAWNTTIQLDHTSSANFGYDLGSGNVTFGSLLIGSGEGTLVDAGIYDAADLNTLTGTSAYFGSGTITVVPEPAATAIAVLGALGLVLANRVRQRRQAV